MTEIHIEDTGLMVYMEQEGFAIVELFVSLCGDDLHHFVGVETLTPEFHDGYLGTVYLRAERKNKLLWGEEVIK